MTDSTVIATKNKSIANGLIRLVRPKQWIKNVFVLAPLVFAGKYTDVISLGESFLAMCLFCLASSAAYIFNDYHDIEDDKKHPVKKEKRVLAAGIVSKRQAVVLLGFIYIILMLAAFKQPGVIGVIVSYLILNIAYSIVLKHYPVIDIFTIAIGFVLRVYAGALAIAVPVSSWMFVTTLCLALYLASVKRRQELIQSGNEGRKVLAHYTVALVERYAEISGTGALLFYSLFVMTMRPEMVLTIPLVIFGLFRYWYIVELLEGGESPTNALFSDVQLIGTVLLWGSACAWLLKPVGV